MTLVRMVLTGALVVALTGPPAVGAVTERADLVKWCTHGSAVAAGRCFGYLLAAEDALSQGGIEGARACIPGNIALREQRELVVRWLQDHPSQKAATALGLVARAYAERYPCK